MAETILIADNDEGVRTTLCRAARCNGFDAQTAESGAQVLEMAKKKRYGLILLETELDGFEVTATLREAGIRTPIILVSGRQEEHDILYGLDIGADDYVTKPFSPVVLGAKIKALIRRSKGWMENTVITAGPFQYNTSTLRFYKHGTEIILSSKENAMMKLFIDNVDRIFSKSMIYDLIWGETIIDENVIMVYINRLRQKIEDDPARPKYIQTVRGLGYRFVV